ncbi:MAG: serine hydrolase domain-containing protein [Acidimicrobiales bacterium]
MTLPERQLADAAAIFEGLLRYRAYMEEVPAVSYGLSHQGKPFLLGAAGTSDVEAGTPATVETAYRVASITKTVTATLVMQLVERALLRLDEPIATYLPWLPASVRTDGVTVRHLLTHSSGLIRDGSANWEDGDLPSSAELHRDVCDLAAVAPPSAGFRYSNVAYALLGEIVEAARKESFSASVEHSVTGPLGLAASGTTLGRAGDGLATGYWRRHPGEGRLPARHTEARSFEPAGGLISTVPDMLSYQAAHFPGADRILSELSKREMQRSQWQRDKEPHHGYGWMIWTVDGIRICGHGGGYAGFNTRIGFAPDLSIAAAVLTNTLGSLAKVGVDLAYHSVARVRALWEDSCTAADAPSRSTLAALTGHYFGRWSDLLVVLVNRSLYLVDTSSDQPLAEAPRLSPVRGSSPAGPAGGDVHFVIASHDDYGNRGEQVAFSLDRHGRGLTLRLGASIATRREV